jgi:hypothetical protein
MNNIEFFVFFTLVWAFVSYKAYATSRAHSHVGIKGNLLRNSIHNLMPAIISIVVLCSALFVILSKGFEDSSEKWALVLLVPYLVIG